MLRSRFVLALAKVSLVDGTLDDATFEAVPAILFRKALTADETPHSDPRHLRDAHAVSERSVLVVAASRLAETLHAIGIDGFPVSPNRS